MAREPSDKTKLKRACATIHELEAQLENYRRRNLAVTSERNEWKERALAAETNVKALAGAVREDRTVGDRVAMLEGRLLNVSRTLNRLEEKARAGQAIGWRGHDAPLVQLVAELSDAFSDRPPRSAQ